MIFMELSLSMLSFSLYQAMGQGRKAGVLFSRGVWLGLVRQTPRLKIELYALMDFYVEIFYDRFTEDPLFLQAFQNMDGLDPYLPQVNIKDSFDFENGG